MRLRFNKSTIFAASCIFALITQPVIIAQTDKTDLSHIRSIKNFGSGVITNILRRFEERTVSHPNLENSARTEDLIRDGELNLSLADALALALENNLDVAVQRYIPGYSQTDLLRSRAGQSPRGFMGSTIPGGLTSGALGAGISSTGAGTGVGSAGGITGGGSAIQVGSVGNFDPTLSINFSYDRVTTPLNTRVVSGIYNVLGQTTAFTTSYAQLLSPGTSYSVTLNGQRQSSTQENLLLNPASVTRFALGINQPLLNGLGRLPNERYIMVARNNTKVAEHVFRLQVINTIVDVENAYWDLAAVQQSVRVAEEALAVARQLQKDNQIRLEIGTMSPLDVTSAESEVAARVRDLTVAQTNLQFQEATLKNMLVKKINPELDAARIVIKDPMPEPDQADIPDLKKALASAMEHRPELQQADLDLENQDISVRFTENALKPDLAFFGFYAGSGLQGKSEESDSGMLDAFGQSFKADYPEYAGGFSLSLSLRNRAAQADNLRSQLERNQMLISRQRSRNTVAMEVRKSIIGLIQGKAQVEAAHAAAELAREIWEGEQSKLEEGASTSYQVILKERDFINAQQAEVAAMITYAKAMVEMDRAGGRTLERNSIEFADALSGKISGTSDAPFTGKTSGERR